MDIASIKQLARQVDDSLPRGRIYHINYSVVEMHTDFYYDRNRDLIKHFEAKPEESIKNIRSTGSNGQVFPQKQAYVDLIATFKRDLKAPRERSYVCDYMVDGVGFYVKKEGGWITETGDKGKYDPTIYASDGKVMGSFYPTGAQATLQPATERPQFAERFWTDIAYQFWFDSLSSAVASMETLNLTSSDGKLVVTGELPEPGKKKKSVLEFRIDKATLRPEEIVILNYDIFGNLNRKLVKRWQYQDYGGVTLPKVVVDEVYTNGVNGETKLADQTTFTINSFSPLANDAKDKLAGLLKSNYSIYDEITGSHYISGKPAEMLDKLSK
jgi:hypothetical protein